MFRFARLVFALVAIVWHSQSASFAPVRFLERQSPLTNAIAKLPQELGAPVMDEELVVGIVVNDEARAYPLNAITRPPREIINDVVGGTAIAVTWCSRCHDAVVFLRKVKEQTLTFGIEGSLWLNNMVMYDAETGSQWVQFTGEAEAGPLKGVELERVPCVITDWQRWKARYPKSTVVAMDKVTGRYVSRLQQQRGKYLLGYELNEQARGYPFDVLRERRIVNDEIGGEPVVVTFDPESTAAAMFSRRVDGEVLRFTDAADGQMQDESGDVWDRVSGKCLAGKRKGSRLKQLPAQVALHQTWMRFHPGSQIQGYGK